MASSVRRRKRPWGRRATGSSPFLQRHNKGNGLELQQEGYSLVKVRGSGPRPDDWKNRGISHRIIRSFCFENARACPALCSVFCFLA